MRKNTPKTVWAKFFDQHAPQYESNVFTKNTVSEVDFLIEELCITPGQNVLDIGCGTGRHAIELSQRGFRVTGLDISAGMLDEAKRNASAAGVEVAWIEADAQEFSLPDQFDAAICICEGAFGLLGSGGKPLDQPLRIIRNISEALKLGANCLFTVLNGFALIRRHTQVSVESGRFDPLALAEISELEPGGNSQFPTMRERGFVPTEITLLFSLAGLEVINIWGGTAGNWGRRPIDLDEIELMVVGTKSQ